MEAVRPSDAPSTPRPPDFLGREVEGLVGPGRKRTGNSRFGPIAVSGEPQWPMVSCTPWSQKMLAELSRREAIVGSRRWCSACARGTSLSSLRRSRLVAPQASLFSPGATRDRTSPSTAVAHHDGSELCIACSLSPCQTSPSTSRQGSQGSVLECVSDGRTASILCQPAVAGARQGPIAGAGHSCGSAA
jgi:hypothetical protein